MRKGRGHTTTATEEHWGGKMNSVSRVWRLASSDDPQDETNKLGALQRPFRESRKFPYRLEIWNPTGTLVEQTLAVTISRIGSVLARWNARKH
jgi:hypothetical protein